MKAFSKKALAGLKGAFNAVAGFSKRHPYITGVTAAFLTVAVGSTMLRSTIDPGRGLMWALPRGCFYGAQASLYMSIIMYALRNRKRHNQHPKNKL